MIRDDAETLEAEHQEKPRTSYVNRKYKKAKKLIEKNKHKMSLPVITIPTIPANISEEEEEEDQEHTIQQCRQTTIHDAKGFTINVSGVSNLLATETGEVDYDLLRPPKWFNRKGKRRARIINWKYDIGCSLNKQYKGGKIC